MRSGLSLRVGDGTPPYLERKKGIKTALDKEQARSPHHISKPNERTIYQQTSRQTSVKKGLPSDFHPPPQNLPRLRNAQHFPPELLKHASRAVVVLENSAVGFE